MAEAGYARVARTIRRAFGGRPPRVVQVQLGAQSTGAANDTTAADADSLQDARAQRVAATLLDPWEQSRAERYRDYREILEEVPELARALQVENDFVFGGEVGDGHGASFEVRFAPDAREEVVGVVNDAVEDLGMHDWIRGVHFEGKWLGDSFTELAFETSPVAIVGERHRRPEWVRVMERNGQVVHYVIQSPERTGKTIIKQPFQIIHYAPQAVRGARYGRSMFASVRALRRKHETMDDILSMLGIQRADGDVFFLWPMPEDQDDRVGRKWIAETRAAASTNIGFDRDGKLRRRIAARLEGVPRILPFRAVRDMDTKPQVVQTRPPDLEKWIKVVEHYERRFFVGTGVPQGLVGSSHDVNAKSTLEVQGIAFTLTVRNDQDDCARILADVFIRALAVRGLVPKVGEYTIAMPDIGSFDAAARAEEFARRATGVQSIVAAGVPLRIALEEGFGLDSDTLDTVDEMVAGGASVDTVLEAVERHVDRRGRRVQIDGAARAGEPGNQPTD